MLRWQSLVTGLALSVLLLACPSWGQTNNGGDGVGSLIDPRGQQITNPGTGAAVHRPPPPVTDPGTGAAVHRPLLPEVTDPGTGAVHRPREITNPPTGGAVEIAPANDTGIVAPQVVFHILINPPGSSAVSVEPTRLTSNTAGPASAAAVGGPPTSVPLLDLGTSEQHDFQVARMSFLDLDNHLRDCSIPFAELKDNSPFCKGKPPLTNGRQCERFSYNQFPEVVKVTVVFPDNSTASCSGTVIAPHWVLTAAHCFLDYSATADYLNGNKQLDFVWSAEAQEQQVFNRAIVEAGNATMLDPGPSRLRAADKVVIYSRYGGQSSKPPFSDDLALAHFQVSFPDWAVQAARLAAATEFKPETTIAGYGYTNADGGFLGLFALTWPVSIKKEAGQLSFSPLGHVEGAFCQGDSGGPVFAGRYRGCKPFDVIPEQRPRLLEGTISFNKLGRTDQSATTEAQRASSSCQNASDMVMQDITLDDRHKWICGTAGNEPDGCK
jgi:Trypsin